MLTYGNSRLTMKNPGKTSITGIELYGFYDVKLDIFSVNAHVSPQEIFQICTLEYYLNSI